MHKETQYKVSKKTATLNGECSVQEAKEEKYLLQKYVFSRK
jgi:hypothetical protein